MSKSKSKETTRSQMSGGGGASPVYGLGMIGALVFYWTRADDDGAAKAKAVGKALVWPAFVVHDLLRHIEGNPSA